MLEKFPTYICDIDPHPSSPSRSALRVQIDWGLIRGKVYNANFFIADNESVLCWRQTLLALWMNTFDAGDEQIDRWRRRCLAL